MPAQCWDGHEPCPDGKSHTYPESGAKSLLRSRRGGKLPGQASGPFPLRCAQPLVLQPSSRGPGFGGVRAWLLRPPAPNVLSPCLAARGRAAQDKGSRRSCLSRRAGAAAATRGACRLHRPAGEARRPPLSAHPAPRVCRKRAPSCGRSPALRPPRPRAAKCRAGLRCSLGSWCYRHGGSFSRDGAFYYVCLVFYAKTQPLLIKAADQRQQKNLDRSRYIYPRIMNTNSRI